MTRDSKNDKYVQIAARSLSHERSLSGKQVVRALWTPQAGRPVADQKRDACLALRTAWSAP